MGQNQIWVLTGGGIRLYRPTPGNDPGKESDVLGPSHIKRKEVTGVGKLWLTLLVILQIVALIVYIPCAVWVKDAYFTGISSGGDTAGSIEADSMILIDEATGYMVTSDGSSVVPSFSSVESESMEVSDSIAVSGAMTVNGRFTVSNDPASASAFSAKETESVSGGIGSYGTPGTGRYSDQGSGENSGVGGVTKTTSAVFYIEGGDMIDTSASVEFVVDGEAPLVMTGTTVYAGIVESTDTDVDSLLATSLSVAEIQTSSLVLGSEGIVSDDSVVNGDLSVSTVDATDLTPGGMTLGTMSSITMGAITVTQSTVSLSATSSGSPVPLSIGVEGTDTEGQVGGTASMEGGAGYSMGGTVYLSPGEYTGRTGSRGSITLDVAGDGTGTSGTVIVHEELEVDGGLTAGALSSSTVSLDSVDATSAAVSGPLSQALSISSGVIGPSSGTADILFVATDVTVGDGSSLTAGSATADVAAAESVTGSSLAAAQSVEVGASLGVGLETSIVSSPTSFSIETSQVEFWADTGASLVVDGSSVTEVASTGVSIPGSLAVSGETSLGVLHIAGDAMVQSLTVDSIESASVSPAGSESLSVTGSSDGGSVYLLGGDGTNSGGSLIVAAGSGSGSTGVVSFMSETELDSAYLLADASVAGLGALDTVATGSLVVPGSSGNSLEASTSGVAASTLTADTLSVTGAVASTDIHLTGGIVTDTFTVETTTLGAGGITPIASASPVAYVIQGQGSASGLIPAGDVILRGGAGEITGADAVLMGGSQEGVGQVGDVILSAECPECSSGYVSGTVIAESDVDAAGDVIIEGALEVAGPATLDSVDNTGSVEVSGSHMAMVVNVSDSSNGYGISYSSGDDTLSVSPSSSSHSVVFADALTLEDTSVSSLSFEDSGSLVATTAAFGDVRVLEATLYHATDSDDDTFTVSGLDAASGGGNIILTGGEGNTQGGDVQIEGGVPLLLTYSGLAAGSVSFTGGDVAIESAVEAAAAEFTGAVTSDTLNATLLSSSELIVTEAGSPEVSLTYTTHATLNGSSLSIVSSDGTVSVDGELEVATTLGDSIQGSSSSAVAFTDSVCITLEASGAVGVTQSPGGTATIVIDDSGVTSVGATSESVEVDGTTSAVSMASTDIETPTLNTSLIADVSEIVLSAPLVVVGDAGSALVADSVEVSTSISVDAVSLSSDYAIGVSDADMGSSTVGLLVAAQRSSTHKGGSLDITSGLGVTGGDLYVSAGQSMEAMGQSGDVVVTAECTTAGCASGTIVLESLALATEGLSVSSGLGSDTLEASATLEAIVVEIVDDSAAVLTVSHSSGDVSLASPGDSHHYKSSTAHVLGDSLSVLSHGEQLDIEFSSGFTVGSAAGAISVSDPVSISSADVPALPLDAGVISTGAISLTDDELVVSHSDSLAAVEVVVDSGAATVSTGALTVTGTLELRSVEVGNSEYLSTAGILLSDSGLAYGESLGRDTSFVGGDRNLGVGGEVEVSAGVGTDSGGAVVFSGGSCTGSGCSDGDVVLGNPTCAGCQSAGVASVVVPLVVEEGVLSDVDVSVSITHATAIVVDSDGALFKDTNLTGALISTSAVANTKATTDRITSSANVSLAPADDMVLSPTGNLLLPVATYVGEYNVGTTSASVSVSLGALSDSSDALDVSSLVLDSDIEVDTDLVAALADVSAATVGTAALPASVTVEGSLAMSSLSSIGVTVGADTTVSGTEISRISISSGPATLVHVMGQTTTDVGSTGGAIELVAGMGDIQSGVVILSAECSSSGCAEGSVLVQSDMEVVSLDADAVEVGAISVGGALSLVDTDDLNPAALSPKVSNGLVLQSGSSDSFVDGGVVVSAAEISLVGDVAVGNLVVGGEVDAPDLQVDSVLAVSTASATASFTTTSTPFEFDSNVAVTGSNYLSTDTLAINDNTSVSSASKAMDSGDVSVLKTGPVQVGLDTDVLLTVVDSTVPGSPSVVVEVGDSSGVTEVSFYEESVLEAGLSVSGTAEFLGQIESSEFKTEGVMNAGEFVVKDITVPSSPVQRLSASRFDGNNDVVIAALEDGDTLELISDGILGVTSPLVADSTVKVSDVTLSASSDTPSRLTVDRPVSISTNGVGLTVDDASGSTVLSVATTGVSSTLSLAALSVSTGGDVDVASIETDSLAVSTLVTASPSSALLSTPGSDWISAGDVSSTGSLVDAASFSLADMSVSEDGSMFSIGVNTISSDGLELAIVGQHAVLAGGDLILQAGSAEYASAGGSTYITGGGSDSGSCGDVVLSDSDAAYSDTTVNVTSSLLLQGGDVQALTVPSVSLSTHLQSDSVVADLGLGSGSIGITADEVIVTVAADLTLDVPVASAVSITGDAAVEEASSLSVGDDGLVFRCDAGSSYITLDTAAVGSDPNTLVIQGGNVAGASLDLTVQSGEAVVESGDVNISSYAALFSGDVEFTTVSTSVIGDDAGSITVGVACDSSSYESCQDGSITLDGDVELPSHSLVIDGTEVDLAGVTTTALVAGTFSVTETTITNPTGVTITATGVSGDHLNLSSVSGSVVVGATLVAHDGLTIGTVDVAVTTAGDGSSHFSVDDMRVTGAGTLDVGTGLTTADFTSGSVAVSTVAGDTALPNSGSITIAAATDYDLTLQSTSGSVVFDDASVFSGGVSVGTLGTPADIISSAKLTAIDGPVDVADVTIDSMDVSGTAEFTKIETSTLSSPSVGDAVSVKNGDLDVMELGQTQSDFFDGVMVVTTSQVTVESLTVLDTATVSVGDGFTVTATDENTDGTIDTYQIGFPEVTNSGTTFELSGIGSTSGKGGSVQIKAGASVDDDPGDVVIESGVIEDMGTPQDGSLTLSSVDDGSNAEGYIAFVTKAGSLESAVSGAVTMSIASDASLILAPNTRLQGNSGFAGELQATAFKVLDDSDVAVFATTYDNSAPSVTVEALGNELIVASATSVPLPSVFDDIEVEAGVSLEVVSSLYVSDDSSHSHAVEFSVPDVGGVPTPTITTYGGDDLEIDAAATISADVEIAGDFEIYDSANPSVLGAFTQEDALLLGTFDTRFGLGFDSSPLGSGVTATGLVLEAQDATLADAGDIVIVSGSPASEAPSANPAPAGTASGDINIVSGTCSGLSCVVGDIVLEAPCSGSCVPSASSGLVSIPGAMEGTTATFSGSVTADAAETGSLTMAETISADYTLELGFGVSSVLKYNADVTDTAPLPIPYSLSIGGQSLEADQIDVIVEGQSLNSKFEGGDVYVLARSGLDSGSTTVAGDVFVLGGKAADGGVTGNVIIGADRAALGVDTFGTTTLSCNEATTVQGATEISFDVTVDTDLYVEAGTVASNSMKAGSLTLSDGGGGWVDVLQYTTEVEHGTDTTFAGNVAISSQVELPAAVPLIIGDGMLHATAGLLTVEKTSAGSFGLNVSGDLTSEGALGVDDLVVDVDEAGHEFIVESITDSPTLSVSSDTLSIVMDATSSATTVSINGSVTVEDLTVEGASGIATSSVTLTGFPDPDVLVPEFDSVLLAPTFGDFAVTVSPSASLYMTENDMLFSYDPTGREVTITLEDNTSREDRDAADIAFEGHAGYDLNGGAITVAGGGSTGGSGRDGGSVALTGGDSISAAGGDVVLTPGAVSGVGNTGSIKILSPIGPTDMDSDLLELRTEGSMLFGDALGGFLNLSHDGADVTAAIGSQTPTSTLTIRSEGADANSDVVSVQKSSGQVVLDAPVVVVNEEILLDGSTAITYTDSQTGYTPATTTGITDGGVKVSGTDADIDPLAVYNTGSSNLVLQVTQDAVLVDTTDGASLSAASAVAVEGSGTGVSVASLDIEDTLSIEYRDVLGELPHTPVASTLRMGFFDSNLSNIDFKVQSNMSTYETTARNVVIQADGMAHLYANTITLDANNCVPTAGVCRGSTGAVRFGCDPANGGNISVESLEIRSDSTGDLLNVETSGSDVTITAANGLDFTSGADLGLVGSVVGMDGSDIALEAGGAVRVGSSHSGSQTSGSVSVSTDGTTLVLESASALTLTTDSLVLGVVDGGADTEVTIDVSASSTVSVDSVSTLHLSLNANSVTVGVEDTPDSYLASSPYVDTSRTVSPTYDTHYFGANTASDATSLGATGTGRAVHVVDAGRVRTGAPTSSEDYAIGSLIEVDRFTGVHDDGLGLGVDSLWDYSGNVMISSSSFYESPSSDIYSSSDPREEGGHVIISPFRVTTDSKSSGGSILLETAHSTSANRMDYPDYADGGIPEVVAWTRRVRMSPVAENRESFIQLPTYLTHGTSVQSLASVFTFDSGTLDTSATATAWLPAIPGLSAERVLETLLAVSGGEAQLTQGMDTWVAVSEPADWPEAPDVSCESGDMFFTIAPGCLPSNDSYDQSGQCTTDGLNNRLFGYIGTCYEVWDGQVANEPRMAISYQRSTNAVLDNKPFDDAAFSGSTYNAPIVMPPEPNVIYQAALDWSHM
ncbi:hypothetical protein KIPB_001080 [Kipferlia bialata]|uniref:Uncharacterized protein n=1 Tax=Kipferlia bialata TaxID=797122 RepID=A0A9K3CNG0_9EUKA|nr:hypothetical protein KIPB_001080 [Kipferlia bialata]|eukprot:g1080.t1